LDPTVSTTSHARGRPTALAAERARSEAITVACEGLYRALFVRLVRRATWKFRLSKDDAAEVVQEAFIVALAKLDVEAEPTAFLYRTVDNLALNHRRKIDRHARLEAEWGPPATRTQEGGEP